MSVFLLGDWLSTCRYFWKYSQYSRSYFFSLLLAFCIYYYITQGIILTFQLSILKVLKKPYLTYLTKITQTLTTLLSLLSPIQADNYMLKVDNRKTRTSFEIYPKLTIKTPKRRQCRHCDVFVVNFEHISELALGFLLTTLNMAGI